MPSYQGSLGPTLIQVHHTFSVYLQTDALDQGEVMASHSFGFTFAYFLRLLLTPRIPTLVLSLVHDDTTFADRPFLPMNDDADAAPPVVDAKLIPLPYAIRLFTEIIRDHLRLRTASHKTLIFQPPLPDDDRRALPHLLHLFLDGSRVSDACFVLAGSPVGTVILIAFNEAARKLHVLPLVYPQLLDRY